MTHSLTTWNQEILAHLKRSVQCTLRLQKLFTQFNDSLTDNLKSRDFSAFKKKCTVHPETSKVVHTVPKYTDSLASIIGKLQLLHKKRKKGTVNFPKADFTCQSEGILYREIPGFYPLQWQRRWEKGPLYCQYM